MSDLLLDITTGDLVIKNGDLVVVGATTNMHDLELAIRQDLSTNLNFLFQEWFLDTLQGIPYFEYILVKNPNKIIIDGIFKDAILAVSGILGLESFSLTYDAANRSFLLKFDARASTGIISFSQGVVVP